MNMAYLTFIGLFIALIVLAFIVSKQDCVIYAEAGKTADLPQEAKTNNCSYSRPLILKDVNGHRINTHKLLRVHVSGICMKPVGIDDGDEVFVEKLSQSLLSNTIVPGDILLLLHPQKGVYKLRILDEVLSNSKLNTYRYEQGEKHRSTYDHSLGDVVGVVRYIVPKAA